jgi:hypothetical protein
MKLEEKLRQGLLGHLSEANTQVDVTIACNIAREFAAYFSVFCAKNCLYVGDSIWTLNAKVGFLTTEELLKIYEDEK